MYKTINGYTKQSMIEAIYKGNNGKKASTESGCSYKTLDGNKCAAGCFIPDDSKANTSGGYIDAVLRMYPELKKCMPLDLDGMIKLQEEHDNSVIGMDIHEVLTNWINENVEDA